ncbi:unnamed protein product [Mycena citricolor]|uniref:Uncharacterized protein n=1 Tax=Mycena citricolor TaxID=2018698 RepID=A0AAD2HWM7_9AGAR|nr:unnamed protein product [Mycena citricolor]
MRKPASRSRHHCWPSSARSNQTLPSPQPAHTSQMHAMLQTTRTAAAVTPAPVENRAITAETQPKLHSGPQCAHCGWRGGGHANNCPFNPATCG